MAPIWPDWLDDVWAKSAEKGAAGKSESLAQHTWDVLSRLTDLIRLRPDLPQTVGVPRLWQVLFWGAFLHDWGKATTGFQARLRGGAKWPHRHEVLSLAFVDWVAANFNPDERAWLVAAIVSHHKDAAAIELLYSPPDGEEDDQLIEPVAGFSDSALQGLWRWLDECSTQWIGDLRLDEHGVSAVALPEMTTAVTGVRQNAVARINYWLKTYRRFVKALDDSDERSLVIGTIALRGHIISADHSASAHAGALPRPQFSSSAIMSATGLSRARLFPHQARARITSGSALLTAPTGSGKTEAALLWAARQNEDTEVLPRLFYTLPYQASMNAMKVRLDDTFGQENVGLQHGRGVLALYRLLLERDPEPGKAAQQARWMRNLAELNYPPVRVFSPYQMLKGMYRLRGYEALLSDYHGAVFIFDEIHAYEVNRLAMILGTMSYLARNYRARFLVMSATFPTLVKNRLRETLGDPIEISAGSESYAQFQRHRLRLLDGELLSEGGLLRIAADAKSGKSVLVVCNIVDRAQATYIRLCEVLAKTEVHCELLHGRFNMRDRATKERLVREATGSQSKHPKPIVLISTQVVEVSLDIDLDVIYTEPAPLEALIQRFGRVNRRRLQTELALVYVFREPSDGQKIYDPELVRRALAILEREDDKPLDESAVGAWLDEVYSGEVAEQWQAKYQRAAVEFEATCVRPLRAFNADASLEEAFYKAFDSIEVLPERLYDEYCGLKTEDPIRASELLVAIRWGQYHALANKAQVLAGDENMPPIVRAAYTSDLGLTFERKCEEDGP
jgi:CRISPR-associated endonuclease/helicase Cas3